MNQLMYWAIGWIGFLLLAAEVLWPVKQPKKSKTGLHHWIASNAAPVTRKQSARSNNIGHWCYSPAM